MRIKTMNSRSFRRAFTLVELMTGISITAILSIAVTSMVMASVNTTDYVNKALDADTQMEFATRRIIENTRTAGSVVTPATTTMGSTLALQTLPDASNKSYTITYALTGTSLTEDDPRYDVAANTPSIIANNVTGFTVTRVTSATGTTMLTVTVSITGATTRSFTMTCRN